MIGDVAVYIVFEINLLGNQDSFLMPSPGERAMRPAGGAVKAKPMACSRAAYLLGNLVTITPKACHLAVQFFESDFTTHRQSKMRMGLLIRGRVLNSHSLR